jgi:hypothetical protein
MKCECGYEAKDEDDLSEHIHYMVVVVDESQEEHRETHN